jgi:hypothetical protein
MAAVAELATEASAGTIVNDSEHVEQDTSAAAAAGDAGDAGAAAGDGRVRLESGLVAIAGDYFEDTPDLIVVHDIGTVVDKSSEEIVLIEGDSSGPLDGEEVSCRAAKANQKWKL